MKFSFESNIKIDRNYGKCTIPADLCKKYKINVDDFLKIKIGGEIFYSKVCGSTDRRINLPAVLLKKLNNAKIKLKILEKAKNRKVKIKTVKIRGRYFLDLYSSLQKKQFHINKDLIIFTENNKIVVTGKGCRNPIKILRFLSLDEKTFEIFGLYQGEGYKKQPKIGARVQFTNSNLDIINFFLQYMCEIFDIDKEDWIAYISYYGKKSKKELINYWCYNTGIPKTNFKLVRYFEGKTDKFKPYGTLSIFVLNTLLIEVVLGILNCIKKIVTKRINWCKAFLRGLLAADSHVKLMKWLNLTSLQMIELAVENEKEAEFYKKILKRIGIKTNDYIERRKLVISNWKNFKKLSDFDAFKLHKDKCESFWFGFKNHTKTSKFLGF